MKKILLSAAFLAALLPATSQVLNGGFEDWEQVFDFKHPVGYSFAFSSNYELALVGGSANVTPLSSDYGVSMHLENVTVADEVYPGYYIMGSAPEQQAEDLYFWRGFPISGEPTGISLDMRFDIPNDNLGFVLVQFKNNDELIPGGNFGNGTYIFPIGGEQPEWNTYQFNFDEFTIAPNQCVIAFSCADVVNSDGDFAPAAYMDVDNISFIGSNDIIPSADMEAWSNVLPAYIPENCEVEVTGPQNNFVRTSDAFQGQWALRLHTSTDAGFSIGSVKFANEVDGELIPTIELEDKNMLSFAYKYQAVDDVASATVEFFQQQGQVYTIQGQMEIVLPANEDYEVMEILLSDYMETNSIQASHIILTFASSSINPENSPQGGSVLKIDEVALSTVLKSSSWLVQNYNVATVNAYPNPTLARAVFNFGNSPETGVYKVFNASGILIDEVEVSQQTTIIYNLMGAPNGLYLFKFYFNSGFYTSEVIKN